MRFESRRYGEWSGDRCRAFPETLRRRSSGADATTTDHFIMYVKDRQANWAEYLLRRRGILVEEPGRTTPKNLIYAHRTCQAISRPPGRDRDKESARPAGLTARSSRLTRCPAQRKQKSPSLWGEGDRGSTQVGAPFVADVPSHRRLTAPPGARYTQPTRICDLQTCDLLISRARSRGVFGALLRSRLPASGPLSLTLRPHLLVPVNALFYSRWAVEGLNL